MSSYQVKRYFCGATSAFREAQNNNEFREIIAEQCGIQITGITGDEEAQIALMGISPFLETLPLQQKQNFFLADLGGGSLEIDLVEEGQCQGRRSFKIGTVRLLNLYNKYGRDSAEVIQLLKEQFGEIQQFLTEFSHINGNELNESFIVGIGGNFRRLIKLKQRIFQAQEDFVLKSEVGPIREKIVEHDYIHRIKHFGLKPDRADVIVPALDIIYQLVESLPVQKIFTPEQGLIDGLMYLLINEEEQGQFL